MSHCSLGWPCSHGQSCFRFPSVDKTDVNYHTYQEVFQKHVDSPQVASTLYLNFHLIPSSGSGCIRVQCDCQLVLLELETISFQNSVDAAKPLLRKAIQISQQTPYWHCRLLFQLAVSTGENETLGHELKYQTHMLPLGASWLSYGDRLFHSVSHLFFPHPVYTSISGAPG